MKPLKRIAHFMGVMMIKKHQKQQFHTFEDDLSASGRPPEAIHWVIAEALKIAAAQRDNASEELSMFGTTVPHVRSLSSMMGNYHTGVLEEKGLRDPCFALWHISKPHNLFASL
jgi:hypothetical protein